MVSVDALTVSFGGWDLFKEISLLVNSRDRIGLVGKNGAGKTTLLKIIAGLDEPTSGSVSRGADTTIGYLPQHMEVADTTTLINEAAKAFAEVLAIEKRMDQLAENIATRTDYQSEEYGELIQELHDKSERFHLMGGDHREAQIEKTLLGLGFRRVDFQRQTSEFSGGWRMRIELAKLLLKRPSIFLLDEPTNHLDIESIQWLEEYLREYEGAVVLISHDKAFLDSVTNRTVEISVGRLYDYKAAYSHYVELRKERREQQMAAYENQQKMIGKTEEFIARFRYKPSKSNQVQSRVKQLEKLDLIEIDEQDLSRMNIKFPPAPRSGQIVAEVKEVGKSFGTKHVFSGADFVIERGDKIALVGRNGEGKTTLARIVVGELEATRGSIRLGHNVQVGYYAQNQESLLDRDATVLETLDRVAVGDVRNRLRDILGAFLFRGGDVDKRVKVLSGGERARLAMAKMMLEPYNLLVMDEPTNHLDMRSKEILKEALKKFEGTLVLVSHDREFLDGLVDKIYEFRDGKVKEFLGGIYDFLESRKVESMREIEMKAKQQDSVKDEASSGRESYAQQKESDKEARRVRNRIKRVEELIVKLETEIGKWETKLADPSNHELDVSDQALFEEYNMKKKELAREMRNWEKLHYELGVLEES